MSFNLKVVLLLLLFAHFEGSEQQYSDHSSSSLPWPGPRNQSGKRPHLHPGSGHPLSGLSAIEGGNIDDASASAAAAAGFPPSRFPPEDIFGPGGHGPGPGPGPPSRFPPEDNFGQGQGQGPPPYPNPNPNQGQGFEYDGQIPESNSKSISGDYCWDPLFSCDTPSTILYCINSRCTCPTGWTLTPGNLPLNTVWDPQTRRCVSLLGSGCHVSPSTIGNGYVYCQPGVRCTPHSSYREVGTCGASCLVNWRLLYLITFLFVTSHYRK